MTNPGWRFDRPRPAAPFLSRIILGGLALLVILAITVTIAKSATIDVDVIHGALASASLMLGVAIGATAMLMAVVYYGMSGRWPWQ